MAARHFAAIDADGRVIAIRDSQSKSYTHAVLRTERITERPGDGSEQVRYVDVVISWHQGDRNAANGLRAGRNYENYSVGADGSRWVEAGIQANGSMAYRTLTENDPETTRTFQFSNVQLVKVMITEKKAKIGQVITSWGVAGPALKAVL